MWLPSPQKLVRVFRSCQSRSAKRTSKRKLTTSAHQESQRGCYGGTLTADLNDSTVVVRSNKEGTSYVRICLQTKHESGGFPSLSNLFETKFSKRSPSSPNNSQFGANQPCSSHSNYICKTSCRTELRHFEPTGTSKRVLHARNKQRWSDHGDKKSLCGGPT